MLPIKAFSGKILWRRQSFLVSLNQHWNKTIGKKIRLFSLLYCKFLSTLTGAPNFSEFIGGTGIIFKLYNFPQGARLSFGQKSLKCPLRCIVISKNKLEIIELFAIFFKIVKIETFMFYASIDEAGLFFHTMFWSRLAYLMLKPKFFRCRFKLAKINWK